MNDHVPAWKKIGLKVKEPLENDSFALTTHLDSGKVTKKQIKQINKRKLKSNEDFSKEKKPPKRQKIPKSERGPPPEKDQLVYLRSYTTDKDIWKFSKQKQNWILKNIKHIENKYENYLVNYLVDVQGGSRDRLLKDLNKVVEIWNEGAKEESKEEESKEEESKEEEKNNDDEEEKQNYKVGKQKKREKKTESNKEKKNKIETVDADYAIRSKKIIKAMTEVDVTLIGIDDQENDKTKGVVSKESTSLSIEPIIHTKSEDTPEPKNNLVIEQVEITDFISDEESFSPQENQSLDSKFSESSEEITLEKEDKTKKYKKEKKRKEKKEKE